MDRILATTAAPAASALRALAAYAAALGIGLAFVLWMFPFPLVAGTLPAPDHAFTDFLQHATGQIAFLATPWHWPLLVVPTLSAPVGVNIAMTDSIPLEAVLLKLLHPALPGMHQGITLWQAFCRPAQSVAAVFALRSFGERRLLPAVAIAILAPCMPTFELRMWHTALGSHFLILLAIGLYGRCTRPRAGRPAFIAFALLPAVALPIHPYLLAMVAALLAALPLSLFLTKSDRWRAGLVALVAGLAFVAVLSRLLGYGDTTGGAAGFGLFSMNLASPFWPAQSELLPFVPAGPASATCCQGYEGYQYLGAGLLLLLLATVAHRAARAALAAATRRHPGLLLALIAITVYAASDQVWLFHLKLLDLHIAYPLSAQLRSSGRLFWDVAYTTLVAATLLVSRHLGRFAPALLLLSALLEFADAGTIRAGNRRALAEMLLPPGPDIARIARILPRYDRLQLSPRLECHGELGDTDMPLLYLASQRAMSTNSMYVARDNPRSSCGAAAIADAWSDRPGRSTLSVLAGTAALAEAAEAVDRGETCGTIGAWTLCSPSGDGLGGLPHPGWRPMPLDRSLPTSAGAAGAPFLADGWSGPEPWGTWSEADRVAIIVPHPTGPAPLVLTLTMHAARSPQTDRLRVTPTVSGHALEPWSVGDTDGSYALDLPETVPRDGLTIVHLAMSRTAHVPGDSRRLGVALIALRLDRRSGAAPSPDPAAPPTRTSPSDRTVP